jgi:hypothetical protein
MDAVMLGGAMVFNWLDLPGWLGFLLGLAGLVAVARVLMLRVLRWRLAQLLSGDRNTAVEDEPR